MISIEGNKDNNTLTITYYNGSRMIVNHGITKDQYKQMLINGKLNKSYAIDLLENNFKDIALPTNTVSVYELKSESRSTRDQDTLAKKLAEYKEEHKKELDISAAEEYINNIKTAIAALDDSDENKIIKNNFKRIISDMLEFEEKDILDDGFDDKRILFGEPKDPKIKNYMGRKWSTGILGVYPQDTTNWTKECSFKENYIRWFQYVAKMILGDNPKIDRFIRGRKRYSMIKVLKDGDPVIPTMNAKIILPFYFTIVRSSGVGIDSFVRVRSKAYKSNNKQILMPELDNLDIQLLSYKLIDKLIKLGDNKREDEVLEYLGRKIDLHTLYGSNKMDSDAKSGNNILVPAVEVGRIFMGDLQTDFNVGVVGDKSDEIIRLLKKIAGEYETTTQTSDDYSGDDKPDIAYYNPPEGTTEGSTEGTPEQFINQTDESLQEIISKLKPIPRNKEVREREREHAKDTYNPSDTSLKDSIEKFNPDTLKKVNLGGMDLMLGSISMNNAEEFFDENRDNLHVILDIYRDFYYDAEYKDFTDSEIDGIIKMLGKPDKIGIIPAVVPILLNVIPAIMPMIKKGIKFLHNKHMNNEAKRYAEHVKKYAKESTFDINQADKDKAMARDPNRNPTQGSEKIETKEIGIMDISKLPADIREDAIKEFSDVVDL